MSASSAAAPEALVPAGGGTGALPAASAGRHAACDALREALLPWESEPGQDLPPALFVDISAWPALPARMAVGPSDAPAGPAPDAQAGLFDAADAGLFVSEVSRAWSADAGLPLDTLARGMAASVDEARMAAQARFEFDIDMPTLGLLQGRVSIADGQADLELRACRPSSAAVLRARQSELQRLVERESGGDVSLFIV